MLRIKSLVRLSLFFALIILITPVLSLAQNSKFYFTGTNCYYLLMFAADLCARSFVDEVLEDAKTMGLKVIRLWAFNDRPGDWNCLQSAPGVFDERVFQGLDYVLVKADELGLKLILVLVNNWPEYGGMNQYVVWDAAYGKSPEVAKEHNDFYTDPDCRGWYKNYAYTLMNRKNTLNKRIYKEDPTIFAWELANEPRAEGDTTGQTIQNWITEMSAYIKKTIGIRQMLGVGIEGIDGVGTDFIRNHSLEYIDFVTVHLWPDKRGMTIDEAISWLNKQIDQARQKIRKPLIVEEFGFKRERESVAKRDELFQKVFETAYNKKIGAMFWVLYHKEYSDYDGYGVYYPEDTSTVAIIKSQYFPKNN